MKHVSDVFLENHEKVAARIVSGDWDAGDADVWLQYACFGKLIFG